jgi:FlaA1/EpsC-like NDP-sugar epimerase
VAARPAAGERGKRMFELGQPSAWQQRAIAWLVGRSRYQKRAILMVADGLLFYAALWLAMAIRYGELYTPPTWQHLLLLCAAPLIAVAVFFRLGLYRVVTRFFSLDTILVIFLASGIAGLLWALAVLLSGLSGVPRTVVLFYPLVGALLMWSMRAAAQILLGHTKEVDPRGPPRRDAKRVIIYGAKTTGVQLLESLRLSGDYSAVGFVDPDPSLWRQQVNGLKVHAPNRLKSLIKEHDVKEVLLAMPRAQRRERREALQRLERLPVAVRTLPAIEDLASGRIAVSDLRDIDPQDLLGREPVPPNPELLGRNIKGRSVLVTGAGGSIGSELVRAVLRQKPRRLILLDRGEEQLYQIGMEVGDLVNRLPVNGTGLPEIRPEIQIVLGSMLDRALVRRTLEDGEVETIYHAAAFKHVPMLEHNAAEGICNNTFGTEVLAEAAEELGVERFVLISTDKAVRPTSIMGASKRLAEMVLQARASEEGGRTVFTIVRFGNVLDSSGSVVRRFREQIRAGGPLTVTHPDVIRYFMSIPEAAALVIQAGAMASGGDVFVLDMGEPVRIADLAKSMIRLAGLEARDAENPYGDIAIEYVGLRAGEKLHEELLLNECAVATEHPRIHKSHEPFLPPDELAAALTDLRAAMVEGDAPIRAVLARAVEGFAAGTVTTRAASVARGTAPTPLLEPTRMQ